ncbi:MAG: oxidoreductase [Acidobacteria bacterium]|nr:oxidoreductase [Acidobacteriota bacterium]
MNASESRTARLVESFDLAPEVRHFVFEVAGVDRVLFEPGQFVSFHHEIGGETITRAYSIASPPNGDNRFELCLNRVPHGPFSNYLFGMHPGDELPFDGPLGFFLLRNPVKDSLFVATGTGVAPLRSMIHHLLQRGTTARLRLLFGTRFQETILYRHEFEELAAKQPNFEFYPTLSREGPNWTGLRGHLQEHLFELLEGRTDMDVYICGLKAMVNDVRTRLKERGFDRHSIIYEKYD